MSMERKVSATSALLAEHQDRLLAWEFVNRSLFEGRAEMSPEEVSEKCGLADTSYYDIIGRVSKRSSAWQKTITTD